MANYNHGYYSIYISLLGDEYISRVYEPGDRHHPLANSPKTPKELGEEACLIQVTEFLDARDKKRKS